jgi:hypothetical protein
MMLAMIAGTPGAVDAIQNQEQDDLVTSTQLPIKADQGDWDVFKSWGIVRGDDVDKWFCNVTLPAGWKKQRTDHSMWSDLLDQNGLKRASIFYKSQMGWVEDAFIHSSRRFYASACRDDYYVDKAPYIPTIKESNGKTLWRGTPVEVNDDKGTAMDKAREIAFAKLKELYPDYDKTDAYWDLADPKFPEWESHEPVGQDYSLHVTMYRDYDGRDYYDGGNHATRRFTDDKTAIAELSKMAQGTLSYCKHVRYQISVNGKNIHSDSFTAPRPVGSMYDESGYGCFLVDNDGRTHRRGCRNNGFI